MRRPASHPRHPFVAGARYARATLLILLALIVFHTSAPSAQAAFGFRKQITINSTKVSGSSDLPNFPVLISLLDPDLRTVLYGGRVENANGFDIVFRQRCTIADLDHEIEDYDPVTGTFVAWVRIPRLSANTVTIIEMQYGDATIVSSQENVAAVWDPNFKGVWHLKEDPSGIPPQIQDSTSNNKNGTSMGAMTSVDQVAGQIDGSLDFDGVNDYVNMGDQPEFEMPLYSWSMWLKGNSAPVVGISNEQPLWNADRQFNFSWSHTAFAFAQAAAHRDSVGWKAAQITTALSGGIWYYVAGTYDGSNISVYLNGALEATQPAGAPLPQVGVLSIGAPLIGGVPFPGQLDEVRISSVVRSADWIATEYNNESSPSTFYSVGPELSEAVCPVPFFTARATAGQNKLEWLNPAAGLYASTKILRRVEPACPSGPTDPVATVVVNTGVAGPGGKDSIVDDDGGVGLANNTTYCYVAYVDADGLDTTFSSGKQVKARPFDTSGRVKWAYSTAAASMAPPGLRFSGGNATVYAVSNDSILHAIQGGAGGGSWPVGWTPRRLGGPAQARPPVLPFTVGSAANGVALLGSQDGNVYAINADDGSQTWSQNIATMVQAAPAGNFLFYDALAKDVVLVGTRNSASANALVALNLNDGLPVWSFTNAATQGGDNTDIGIISGSVSVDYATRRLFFASRQRAGGSANTIWCIDFDSGSPSLVWARPIGDIDGSPILWGGVVYVGTNAGSLYGLDAATGNNNWPPLALGDGAIKGFVFPQFGTGNRFVSTIGNVWSIADSGAARSVNLGWPVTSANVPSPSIPTYVPGSSEVLVGSSDGNLYQLNVTTPVPTLSVTLGDGGGAVGAPTMDLLNSMIYVGTAQGVIYGVEFPLP
ncbi:MAG: hypothetical protein BMS9Abin37_1238 [Acidobacteriota bacterium]|nr:MAG: hypothetical protein BMS9Abin37_1238 [Acidobacteriota bacterium]